jgi:DNA-binding transcriptional LysR family regulator
MYDVDTAFLRTFVALAETRSFSKAAARVGRSQSAVSGQIKKLEETFARQLLERDTRNVRLTDDGEKLLAYARDMIAAADAMLARFRVKEVIGEVRFGSPEDFATAYLPEILAAFSQAHPQVQLHMSCALTLTLIAEFEAGEHDLVIVKQPTLAHHTGARPLWREELVWVGPQDETLPADFSEAQALFAERRRPTPLVLSPAPCVYRSRALAALEIAKVAWTSAYASPSHAGCAAAVRAGLGYAVMPQGLIPEGLRALSGWPALDPADLCLLQHSRPSVAAAALAHYIEGRMAALRGA